MWEALGYAASLLVLRRSLAAAPSTAPFVALTGLMLFTACAWGSIALHDIARRFDRCKQEVGEAASQDAGQVGAGRRNS